MAYTTYTKSDIIRCTKSLIANNQDRLNLLHSETLADVRRARSLSKAEVIELHWEVYHTLND